MSDILYSNTVYHTETLTDMKTISVILPCYNEGKNIYENILFLYYSLHITFSKSHIEIILVNDGSTDNTLSEFYRIQKEIPQILFKSYQQNKGKGYAIKQGLEISSGSIIALFDSDLDITVHTLLKYIKYIQKNKQYDIIVGNKHDKKSKIQRNLKRKIISEMNIKINSILFGLAVKDTQVGLKVFRKKGKQLFLENVHTKGYAFDLEFLYYANLKKLNIKELPVILSINTTHSHVGFLTIYTFLRDILSFYTYTKKSLGNKKVYIKTRLTLYLLKSITIPVSGIIKLSNFIKKIAKL